MRMYLKNNDELKSNLTQLSSGSYQLAGEFICNLNGCTYIDTVEDFDILNNIKFLPSVFLKATKIGTVRYSAQREHGLYAYGKASAKLFSKEKDYYYLEVETSSWEGIADMKTLQEKIQAGTILPIVSYERKQVKNHLLEVLSQILDSKSLTKVQRFFLAWRLSNSKK